jgi:hypothetical protein
MTDNPQMPRKDWLRRVVILCCSFARNLAYYRVAWSEEYRPLLGLKNAHANFWRAANNNFIDMCVLEWCKLFGDTQGKHYWGKIVTSMPKSVFEESLLRHLGFEADAFKKEISVMHYYRDKFLAHLDLDYSVILPTLDVAKKAVWFYHAHIVNREANPGDLAGLPLDLKTGYE